MIQAKRPVRDVTRPAPQSEFRSTIERLDANERTTPFSDEEFARLLATLTPYDIVAYGELEPFYRKIVSWLDVPRDRVLLTAGSDTGIRAIFETFVEQGDEVIILVPTYAMFSVYSRMFGAVERNWTYGPGLTLDIDKMIADIRPETRLVVIANPNHTGAVISEEELLKIAAATRERQALLLVDEAYHHFYPQSFVEHIDEFDNLIISRTFSKAFGLAALRIGLLSANPNLIKELYRVKLVHEISGMAAKIGQFMLDNPHIMESYVEDVNAGKEYLYTELPNLGCEVLRSEANFVFFKLPDLVDGRLLVTELQSDGIYIKGPFDADPFEGHLRVTVGPEKQMHAFVEVLASKMANGNS